MEALRRFEAENAVSTAKFELEHYKLRQALIEKYGAEGVEKVDQKIESQWREENE